MLTARIALDGGNKHFESGRVPATAGRSNLWPRRWAKCLRRRGGGQCGPHRQSTLTHTHTTTEEMAMTTVRPSAPVAIPVLASRP
jgi:hypothetical protein